MVRSPGLLALVLDPLKRLDTLVEQVVEVIVLDLTVGLGPGFWAPANSISRKRTDTSKHKLNKPIHMRYNQMLMKQLCIHCVYNVHPFLACQPDMTNRSPPHR